jgi:hypothetical protein
MWCPCHCGRPKARPKPDQSTITTLAAAKSTGLSERILRQQLEVMLCEPHRERVRRYPYRCGSNSCALACAVQRPDCRTFME